MFAKWDVIASHHYMLFRPRSASTTRGFDIFLLSSGRPRISNKHGSGSFKINKCWTNADNRAALISANVLHWFNFSQICLFMICFAQGDRPRQGGGKNKSKSLSILTFNPFSRLSLAIPDVNATFESSNLILYFNHHFQFLFITYSILAFSPHMEASLASLVFKLCFLCFQSSIFWPFLSSLIF